MVGYRQKPFAYAIFSIKRRFLTVQVPTPLGSKRHARDGAKRGTFLQSGYFSTISSSRAETVADRNIYAAYHN